MTQKVKLCIGIAGLALLIGAASIAYNALAARVEPAARLALPGQAAQAAQAEEWAGDGAAPQTAQAAQRQRAPDFAMTDWDGNTLRLSDIIAGGRPVALNFWASWCPSCRREKPAFEAVYRDMGDQVKFVMLGLADGMRETVETGQRYITDGGFTLPVYFDTLREGAAAYGIRFIPATVFIDASGYIAAEAQGALDEQSLRRAIGLLLQ